MSVTIQFLGAAGTVTGSKYLVRSESATVMVDGGLFQGDRRWREENWKNVEFDLRTVDAVLVTHAHIDHIGMLPRFVKLGLKCPIFCTRATAALMSLLLPDSARMQEEEAEYRSQRKKSRHQPALPLYTEADARATLDLIKEIPFGHGHEVLPQVYAEWRHAGHILGAASIHLTIEGRTITFSGDIGRYNVPILRDPEPVIIGDLLLIESTYGDSVHKESDPRAALAQVIRTTAERGGVIVIPSFAIGRVQLLLYYLRELKEQQLIPDLPIIVDSPMASDATKIYEDSIDDYDETALGIVHRGKRPFSVSKLGYIRDRSESIKLNSISQPMIIISASGMLSGGRILHHLKHRISNSKNTVLFVGHQPHGGKGDSLLKGEKSLRILGEVVEVRAQISQIGSLSAHGDQGDLLRWCRQAQGIPNKVAVVHGEPEVAQRFSQTIKQELGWDAFVPNYRQRIEV